MDIDIDFANRDLILSKIQHHVAKLENGKKHNTGIYATPIPHNPIDNLSTIDYKTAEDRKYFKLDFLNVSIYKDVRNNAHMDELVSKEPMWDLLQYKEFSDLVFHVSGHHAILQKLKPNSLEKLAACLAIIRPAKRYLLDKDWYDIYQEVWTKPTTDQYFFKKAHAFSYAMAVVVHINLLCETPT
jgi:DNA polymerase III alpha subunit